MAGRRDLIDRPGEVRVQAAGGEMTRHDAPDLTEAGLARPAWQLAASANPGGQPRAAAAAGRPARRRPRPDHRPDRSLQGELRGPEAFAFPRAVNAGHPGSITTIHADGPAGAIDQITMLALMSSASVGWPAIEAYARRVINVVAQLKREDGRRVVAEVLFRPGREAQFTA